MFLNLQRVSYAKSAHWNTGAYDYIGITQVQPASYSAWTDGWMYPYHLENISIHKLTYLFNCFLDQIDWLFIVKYQANWIRRLSSDPGQIIVQSPHKHCQHGHELWRPAAASCCAVYMTIGVVSVLCFQQYPFSSSVPSNL